MISILIATYQWDTEPLVTALVNEISEKNILAEIICMDDASGFVQNDKFLTSPFLTYIPLEQNVGRSVIRNKLAKSAKYPLLLFLDADSLPKAKNFISGYLSASEMYDVVCGGTAYYDHPPGKQDELLRWLYGREREQRPANNRQIFPYHSFTSNNFLIRKSTFELYSFDEEINEYGHEDTLFGIELKRNSVKIGHIDNPVYHMGLDKGELFIQKTVQAVKNLAGLYVTGKVSEEVRLIRMFLRLRKWRLLPLFKLYFKAIESNLYRNLLGNKPILRNLDMLKLGLFCRFLK